MRVLGVELGDRRTDHLKGDIRVGRYETVRNIAPGFEIVVTRDEGLIPMVLRLVQSHVAVIPQPSVLVALPVRIGRGQEMEFSPAAILITSGDRVRRVVTTDGKPVDQEAALKQLYFKGQITDEDLQLSATHLDFSPI